ncbi:MAG: MFS transporter [Syntrophobacteraceae bacterium]
MSTKPVSVPSYGALLATCCAVTHVYYLGSYMRIPVVPLFARSLGATTAQVGIINGMFLLMAGVLSLPLGMLSDRIGRKLLILCGLFIAASTSLLLCVTSAPVEMMAVYLVFGVGLAAFAPTMMSYVADFSPVTHLGRSYAYYTMALYAGMSLGPAVGGLMAEELGYKSVFVISGIIILITLAIVFFFLPRARHIVARRPERPPVGTIARDLFRNRRLLACWLVTVGSCLAMGTFITFVPLLARDHGISLGQIGLIFAFQAIFSALSRIPFGRLIDRVTRKDPLVTIGFLGLSASIASVALASSINVFLLCATGAGISMGLAFTSVGALIPEVVGQDARGLAMGGYNSAIYLGMMMGSLVMGLLIRYIGFQGAFCLAAGINLLTTGTFQMMLSTRSGATSA